MDVDSLGGAGTLQAAAQHLSTLVFGTAGLFSVTLRSVAVS